MITTTSSDSDEPDIRHIQRISRETVEYLRNMHSIITTGKIERGVVDALRKSGVVAKVERHERQIMDHEQRWNILYRKFTAAFGNFIHMDDNQERKK